MLQAENQFFYQLKEISKLTPYKNFFCQKEGLEKYQILKKITFKYNEKRTFQNFFCAKKIKKISRFSNEETVKTSDTDLIRYSRILFHFLILAESEFSVSNFGSELKKAQFSKHCNVLYYIV